jgi:hypothetical protein
MMTRRACLTWLLRVSLLPVIACAGTSSQPDRKALRRLLREVLKERLTNKLVYVSRQPLPGGTKIPTWRTEFQVPNEYPVAWFYFIDDAPEANWEHPCRYVFVEVKRREHEVVKARTPPRDLSSMLRLENDQ